MKKNLSKIVFSGLITFVILAAFALPSLFSGFRERQILKEIQVSNAETTAEAAVTDPADRLELIYSQIAGTRAVTMTEQKNIFTGDSLNYVLDKCLQELKTLEELGLLPVLNYNQPATDCSCDAAIYSDRENFSGTVKLWRVTFSVSDVSVHVWMDEDSCKIYTVQIQSADTEAFADFYTSYPEPEEASALWCDYLGIEPGKIGKRIRSFVVNSSGVVFVFSNQDNAVSILFSGVSLNND